MQDSSRYVMNCSQIQHSFATPVHTVRYETRRQSIALKLLKQHVHPKWLTEPKIMSLSQPGPQIV